LAIFGQWSRFGSERAFYRFAKQQLIAAFPSLPDGSGYNRLARKHRDTTTYMGHSTVPNTRSGSKPIDGSAVPVCDRHRRGNNWLCGQADVDYSHSLSWYYGFRLLVVVTA
jgi:hypothetical protein